MYMSNASLRGVDEEIEYDQEMIDELLKCSEDPIYFIENYVKIISKSKLVTFEMRDYQKKYIDLLQNNTRSIIKWGRQSGKSISTAAFIVWKIVFGDNIKVLLAADQLDKAVEQLKRIKEMIELLPVWMQQGVKTWNAKRIILANSSEVRAAATHPRSASGYTVNFLYLDEFALVEPSIARDFVSSVFPTVSSDPNAQIAISSTPRGIGNPFHELWEKAERSADKGELKRDDFRFLSIEWNDVPGRDEAWKQSEIEKIGELAFNQEYACKFLGSSATLIDSVYIKELQKLYEKDPIDTLDNKRLRIYHKPIDKRTMKDNNYEYLITVDPAMGTRQDYSAMHVWLLKSNIDIVHCATYHSNNVPPMEMTGKILFLAKLYHDALVLVETNEPAGGIIVNSLKVDHEYYNLVNMQKEGVGFRTHHEAKIKSCTYLQVYCEKLLLKMHDSRFYQELSTYGKKGSTYKAIGDGHDDLISAALMMLFYVNSKFFYGNISEKSIYKHKSYIQSNGANTTMDELISKALDELIAEDYSNEDSGPLIINGTRQKYEDAVHWKQQPIPSQKNNPMFNPHANGNSFRYYPNNPNRR